MMSRRKTDLRMNLGESEDSSENNKPQSPEAEGDRCKTPPPTASTDVRVSRSGRKLTPVRCPNFLYTNCSKIMQNHDKRKISMASTSKAAIADPSDSSDSENANTRDDSMEAFIPNDACFENDRDVAGENMYAFRTPKKRNALQTLVANTPKTPRTPKTPATALRALSLNSPRTPKSNRKESTPLHTKTPHRERTKLQKEMKKRSAVDLDSDSDGESDVSDDKDTNYVASGSDTEIDTDSSVSDTDGACAQPTRKNQMLKNVRIAKPIEIVTSRSARLQRRKQLAEPEFLPQSDNYFSAASTKKVKTSDHTLDRLKSSGLQYDDIFALLRTIELSDEHRTATTEMIQEHSQNFASWMLQLSKGFNIVVFGIGSKQCVLQQFCETYPDRPYVIVNGFFPTLTVKDILNAIRTDIVTISPNARTDHEVVDAIAAAFQRSPNTHLFLVIHNIDGPMLRKTKDQHILSRLAKIPNIHLLASVDHINAPLMWDQTCLSNYNFVWYDCTTMVPYTNETAFENSVFLQNSGELNLAAMNNVFQSLTTNARGIYMLLVESHMKNRKYANFQGMAFKDLYHACRERFLVSSDLALRTQLNEFFDHNMAKRKRGIDHTELIAVPIDAHVLEQFIEQQKD